MSNSNNDVIRDAVLEAFETSLEAQLKAVRRLRAGSETVKPAKEKSISQIDMAFDILSEANEEALHIAELLKRIETKFHLQIDRESLVSALTKKVQRQDRFVRTDKNTFGIRS